MKKQILSALAIATLGLSLNAAVYATVDGEEVTDKDMQMLMSQMPPQMFQNGVSPEMKKKLVDQAIDQKLLSKEAIQSGVEKEKEFQLALEELKKSIALDVWMKKVYKNVKVDEKDIKEYFEKNKDKLVEPKRAKASHILLKTEAEAKDIIKELSGLSGEKLNEKFAALAKEKSTGPSGPNGGQLGWFDERSMVPEFSKAAFGLKSGEITKTPVKTEYGYHVILTEDKKGGNNITYEDAKARIENGLRMEKFQETVSKKAQELRKKANIVLK
ncbi:MAG TPA: peptidylprolyl isomerase [Sulfurospirillum sp. UBA12182]|jgi:parvulin-like peptidyl-prolyl isomerase|nr:MAG TPA: peptidylprolyl isomerase [Sulfurospirillum sp. UBA12182]